eukprot:m.222990 g.222990  ORF g.222990 m.222990 type:complete len:86 (-) comp10819_c1_seq6:1389-1646(-)
MEGDASRVIMHIDLDAFFSQVEEHRHPELYGKPLVVQQWGLLVAISYEARRRGVQRWMKLKEAQRACPSLVVAHSELVNGKVRAR